MGYDFLVFVWKLLFVWKIGLEFEWVLRFFFDGFRLFNCFLDCLKIFLLIVFVEVRLC